MLHRCCIRSSRREHRVRQRGSNRATPRSTPNSYIDIPKSTSNTAAGSSACRWLGFARPAAKPLQKAAVCGEATRATKVTAVLASAKLATFPHRVFVKISDRSAFDKPHATTTRRTSTHRSSTGIKSRAHGFTLRAALSIMDLLACCTQSRCVSHTADASVTERHALTRVFSAIFQQPKPALSPRTLWLSAILNIP